MNSNQQKCNWVKGITPWTLCGEPAVMLIYQVPYCQQHGKAAERMFGPGQRIVVEEMFDEAELKGRS